LKRAEKPHSKSAHREMPDGPATRPLKSADSDARKRKPASRIRPGDWGKVESGWLVQPLIHPLQNGGRGTIHQFLWRCSRTVSKREKGTERRRTMEKPFPAGSSSSGRFRARANRSYPEGKRLLLCISTERAALAVVKKSAKLKAPKGVTKRAPDPGRIREQASPVNLPKRRRSRQARPLACEQNAA